MKLAREGKNTMITIWITEKTYNLIKKFAVGGEFSLPGTTSGNKCAVEVDEEVLGFLQRKAEETGKDFDEIIQKAMERDARIFALTEKLSRELMNILEFYRDNPPSKDDFSLAEVNTLGEYLRPILKDTVKEFLAEIKTI